MFVATSITPTNYFGNSASLPHLCKSHPLTHQHPLYGFLNVPNNCCGTSTFSHCHCNFISPVHVCIHKHNHDQLLWQSCFSCLTSSTTPLPLLQQFCIATQSDNLHLLPHQPCHHCLIHGPVFCFCNYHFMSLPLQFCTHCSTNYLAWSHP